MKSAWLSREMRSLLPTNYWTHTLTDCTPGGSSRPGQQIMEQVGNRALMGREAFSNGMGEGNGVKSSPNRMAARRRIPMQETAARCAKVTLLPSGRVTSR